MKLTKIINDSKSRRSKHQRKEMVGVAQDSRYFSTAGAAVQNNTRTNNNLNGDI